MNPRLRHTAFGLDRSEIRRQDYSLDDEQRAIRETFSRFFLQHSPATLVRESEPLGFDADLWKRLTELGAISTRLPDADGSDTGSTVDLVLIAEEAGRAAAPVPYAEVAAAVGALVASGDASAASLATAAGSASTIVAPALDPVEKKARQLVPAGAVAAAVLALDGAELVLLTRDQPPAQVANLGTAPLAWWDLRDGGQRTVIASGEAAAAIHERARRDWQLLTAAALVGAGKAAITLAVEFAKTRLTSGVPIGALQGVSHPLARAEALISASRHLNWKAAWFHDEEPGVRPELVPMAFAHATSAATFATTTALHMQGGFGFTLESDVTLYFRRAKGWSIPGNPRLAIRAVADELVSSATKTKSRGTVNAAHGLQPA